MKNEILKKLENIVYNPPFSASDILDKLKTILSESDIQNKSESKSKTISNLFAENVNCTADDNKGPSYIKSGFTELDHAISGFYPGEFIVIGGRPSMGKTQFLINLALNISVKYPILFFSFDLSPYFLINRFVSSLSNIPINKILQKRLTSDEFQKVTSIEKNLESYKIFINHLSIYSSSSISPICYKHLKENDIKIVILDCFQDFFSNTYYNQGDHDLSYIIEELEQLARELNLCVILTSQLSRSVEERCTRRPELSDLDEISSFEKHADKILLINSPEYYNILEDEEGNSTVGLIELIIAKNKNGYLGNVKLYRDRAFTSIHNLVK